MKKRRHHFVWQHYLDPWTIEGQIACYRAGRVFRTNTSNIGVVTDFYRLRELTEHDVNIVRLIIVDQSPPESRDIHENWLSIFTLAFRLRRLYAAGSRVDKGLEQYLDEALSNTEEDLHARIEDDGAEFLRALRTGDAKFFDTLEGFSRFIYFLCVQYMRTKKIRTAVLAAMGRPMGLNAPNAWGVMSHMFATNMGASFVGQRQDFRITVLRAPAGIEFITTDQPVINTRAANKRSPSEIVDDVEFYYPVAPSLAVLVGDEKNGQRLEHVDLTATEVAHYNRLMLQAAHEQVYSLNENILEGFLSEEGRM